MTQNISRKTTEQLSLKVTKKLRDKLEEIAEFEDATKSDVVRYALDMFITNY
jgi:predicted transcriptional regulator|tara:strand:+ start:1170 stop:1325 length:156 start_codon:yes stop_codon:yes gene_type:complete